MTLERGPTTKQTSARLSFGERTQLWLNIIGTVAAGVPMALEPLRQMLPYHYYGVLATGAALTNLAINAMRLHDVRATRHPDDDTQDAGA